MKKAVFHEARWNEPIIMELGAPGERGILVPKTIVKSVRELIEISSESEKTLRRADGVKLTKSERKELIEKLEKEMKAAAKMLEFELAAQLRDEIVRLRGEVK